jgi:hypothetical protein
MGVISAGPSLTPHAAAKSRDGTPGRCRNDGDFSARRQGQAPAPDRAYARTAGLGDPFANASNCMSRSRSGSMSLSGIMFGPSDGARSGS